MNVRFGGCLLAAVLCGVAVAWVIQAEYRYASIQLGSALPAIPALAGLLVLAAALRVVRRSTQESRRTVAGAYAAAAVASAIASTPSMVYLFGQMTAAQSQNELPGMSGIASMVPNWIGPPAGVGLKAFLEGSPGGSIPWSLWLRPALSWGVLLITLLTTLAAALSLVRRSWMEHERLAYPMVQIPMRILTAAEGGRSRTAPLFWIGFGITACLDGLNMLRAFYPSTPALGAGIDIGAWFTSPPWSSLAPLWVSYRPEILGLAFLMPGDVLLTAWLSYLLLRLSSVARAAAGSPVLSTAYDYQEMGMGAFLCLFALLIIRAWPELRRTWRLAFRSHQDDVDEPMPFRVAWALALLGPLFMVLWLRALGMPLWVAAVHLGLLLSVAIVYARIRCETGTPSVYLFPFWQQQSLLTNLWGSQALAGSSGQGLVALAAVGGLSRGVLPEIAAYSAEGMSLAAQTGARQRHLMGRYLFGVVVGLLLGGTLYLAVCYRHGADNIGGGYQLAVMRQQYGVVAARLASPDLPRPALVMQTCIGGLIAFTLNWMRQKVLWFPFHPVGFAMTSAYGYHLWFPFLLAWIAKSLILRMGGHGAYMRMMPLFLGIAMGRYLFTGIVWGLLGMTGHPAVQSYQIHFS